MKISMCVVDVAVLCILLFKANKTYPGSEEQEMFASQFNKKRQQWSGELASAGQTLARHMLFVFCVVDRMRILLLMFDIYWSRDRRCSAASNLPLLTCRFSPITSKSARHYRAAHTWIRPISILLMRYIQENCRNSIIDHSAFFFCIMCWFLDCHSSLQASTNRNS
jgi:hypothetical protein